MFQLDESFLESLGLEGMPEGEKAGFLAYVQGELEERAGERMSEGMSDAQMEEFERIVEGDGEVISRILAESGDYKADPVYLMMVEKNGFVDGAPETLAEYASVKWMMKNRPDYAGVVEGVMGEIRKEIEGNRDKLLSRG